MRKRKDIDIPLNEKALLSMEDLMAYTSSGYPTARKLAEEAGATVKLGTRVLFKREKIDEYLSSI